MTVSGVSSSQLQGASAADLYQMMASRQVTKQGYQARIESPDEKNPETKDRFKAEMSKLDQDIAEIRQIAASKSTQTEQSTNPVQPIQPTQNQNQVAFAGNEQVGQKLNFVC